MIFKQISKNKKAKQSFLSAKADTTNETFQNSTTDAGLTDLPNDNEYAEFGKTQNSDTVNQTERSNSKEKTD